MPVFAVRAGLDGKDGIFPLVGVGSAYFSGNDLALLGGGLILGDARRELEAKDAEASMIFADLLSSSLYNAQLVQKLNDLTIID